LREWPVIFIFADRPFLKNTLAVRGLSALELFFKNAGVRSANNNQLIVLQNEKPDSMQARKAV